MVAILHAFFPDLSVIGLMSILASNTASADANMSEPSIPPEVRPRRKSSLILIRTHKTFLDFSETSESPISATTTSCRTLRRSSTDPVFAIDCCEEADEAVVQQVITLPVRNRGVDRRSRSEVTVPPPPPPTLKSSPGGASSRKDPNHKLFVGGLSCTTDEAMLYQFMSRFGPVKNVTVKRNPVTGQSRRYAFVKFYNPPSTLVYEHSWMLDDHAIRITKYLVSPEWKNHYYSDDEDSKRGY